MNWITLDAELRQKLGDLTKLRVVRDESGRVLGQFVPTPAEVYEPPFDKAELERIVSENRRWYSSEDVAAMLRKLEAEHP